jgi:hypothetical protein
MISALKRETASHKLRIRLSARVDVQPGAWSLATGTLVNASRSQTEKLCACSMQLNS